jgi:SNF2 family DNA or RNA helicase
VVDAEGIDFQFCDILVNYDLPWNPMQVEQPIGRLDCFGQEHERIRIYNLYIEDTIETRIFQRLYDRIRIFEQSIGEFEDILGEEISKLSRDVLQKNLTPAEQERLAEQAAARIIRARQEAEHLEREKDNLLGQDRIFDQEVIDTIESGHVISPEELQALVST